MLLLPKSTEYNKLVPKKTLETQLKNTFRTLPAGFRQALSQQVKAIHWRNKLTATLLNLPPGKTVEEIQVFHITLNAPELNRAFLQTLDEGIPYPILFLLEHEGRFQAAIAYKEKTVGGEKERRAFQVTQYYHSDWTTWEELPIEISGFSLDAVYENFVRQLAHFTLKGHAEATLRQCVAQQRSQEELLRKIEALRTKMRREVQLNRQFELFHELKALEAQLLPAEE